MDNKILTLPSYIKVIFMLFSLGGLFCIIFFKDYSIVYLLDIIIFSILFYFSSVKYIFADNKIIIEYPFFYSKEYNTKNIIGYAFIISRAEMELTLFMNNDEKIKMKIFGKKIKEYINSFINKMNIEIQNKNIEELKNKGIEYCFRKNNKLLFTVDYMEILEKDIQKRYYYKTDIQNIIFQNYNGVILIKIYLNDKKTLHFNNYKLKGKIGLFKYLEEKKNTPKRRIKGLYMLRCLWRLGLHKNVVELAPFVRFCSAAFLWLLERSAFLCRNRKNVIYRRNVMCNCA